MTSTVTKALRSSSKTARVVKRLPLAFVSPVKMRLVRRNQLGDLISG
jgi:hypothetical protein